MTSSSRRLETAFEKAEASYARMREEYEAGKISPEQFKQSVEANPIEHGGYYWMLGVSSGKWYRYDGSTWSEADPPTRAVASATPKRAVASATPKRTRKAAAVPTPPHGVSTIAGSTKGYADGDAATARFKSPRGIALDKDGNLIVADTGNRAIRIISADGQVRTICGGPRLVGASRDGDLNSASFSDPGSVCIDDSGTIFVAEMSGTIRMISLADQQVKSLTGAARGLTGITASPDGGVWVCNSVSHQLVWIAPGKPLRVIGAQNTGGSYGDGPPGKSKFNSPMGIVCNSAGSLYIADSANHCIRKAAKDGSVSTIAGTGPWPPFGGFKDGSAREAQFKTPQGVAVDSRGRIYVADTGNNRIRRIDLDSTVRTLAGSGRKGLTDGAAGESRFDWPSAVVVAPDGTVYIADTANHCIRAIRQ